MSTNWIFDGGPSAEWRSGTGNRTDNLLYNPVEAPSAVVPVGSSINLPSTTLGGTAQAPKSTGWGDNWKTNWESLEEDFLTTPFNKVNASTGTGTTPLPNPPPEGGLTSWFAKEGNMNMLGTAATGVNMLTGLAGMLSNLETAGKQRKLLDQQLAHNKATMNNRKQLINQLKGSY